MYDEGPKTIIDLKIGIRMMLSELMKDPPFQTLKSIKEDLNHFKINKYKVAGPGELKNLSEAFGKVLDSDS